MFRALVVGFGATIVVLVILYFVTGRPAYLAWARRLFAVGLAAAVVFFAVLLVKRLT
jgi:hypothetical protein